MLVEGSYNNVKFYYDNEDYEYIGGVLEYKGKGRTIVCPKNYYETVRIKEQNMTGRTFSNFSYSPFFENCTGELDLTSLVVPTYQITASVFSKIILPKKKEVSGTFRDFGDIEVDTSVKAITYLESFKYEHKVLDLCSVEYIKGLYIVSNKLQVLDLSSLKMCHKLTLDAPNLKYIKLCNPVEVDDCTIKSDYIKKL